MKISIIGTGAYSIALASKLNENKGNQIFFWTHDENLKNEFNTYNSFDSILKYKFDEQVKVSTDINNVINNSDLIILATSSTFFKSIINQIKTEYNNVPICIATKGMDENEFLFEIAQKELNSDNISVLSGPSFAIDLINCDIIGLTIASTKKEVFNVIKTAFRPTTSSNTINLEYTNDLVATSIFGCIKNIYAIGSGILNGLGCSNSTTSMYITLCTKELSNLTQQLGSSPNSILLFAGLGDLILTCSSKKSRNFNLGVTIAQNKDFNEYLRTNTAEGYNALITWNAILKGKGINVPIIEILYNIVIENKKSTKLTFFLQEDLTN